MSQTLCSEEHKIELALWVVLELVLESELDPDLD